MGAARKARGRTATRPNNLGLVFEHFAGSDGASWNLDRPFDLTPKGDTRYTVAELAQLVEETSAGLYEVGLRYGDRLAIVKDNHLDSVVIAAAAARIGAIPALCSATVKPAMLRRMMQRLEPRVLVASSTLLADAAAEGIELVPEGTPTVLVGGAAGDAGPSPGSLPTFADLTGSPVPAARPRPDDEPMVCTHTSGTTGLPKFVVHTANTSIGTNARLETMRIPFLSTRDDDVIVSSIAFVHVRCLTWTVAQLTLPPREVVVIADPRPESVVRTLTRHRPTTLEACPNIYQLWEGLTRTHPELFANVRAYLSTFDAIHPPTVRAFLRASRRRLPVWGQSWGQSEFGPASLAVYTKWSVRRRVIRRSAGSERAFTTDVGFPIPGVIKWKVVDPETRCEVRRGRPGLVLVRSRGRCLTYLGEDDRHRAKDWGGWWNTGDIGVHRRSGRLRILDREVDSLPGTSGIELESLLLDRLDGATEVIVLGNPGGLPVPVVSMRDGRLDPAAWRRATAGLPALAGPRLVGWEEFPRTGTWKVRRPDLRQRILGRTETFGTGDWT